MFKRKAITIVLCLLFSTQNISAAESHSVSAITAPPLTQENFPASSSGSNSDTTSSHFDLALTRLGGRSELRNATQIALLGISDAGLLTAAQIVQKIPTVTIQALDDSAVIKRIHQNISTPGHEPIISDLIRNAKNERKLEIFTLTDELVQKAVGDSQIIIIDAGNPEGLNSATYRDKIQKLAKQVGSNLKHLRTSKQSNADAFKAIILRGTVPVGLTRKIENIIRIESENDTRFGIAYWPDYHRKGVDSPQPAYKPVVIGLPEISRPWEWKTDEQLAQSKTWNVIRPIIKSFGEEVFPASLEAAELSKHNLILYLAAKVALLNSLHPAVWHHWGNLVMIGKSAGLDERIGLDMLTPTMAIGGRLMQFIRFLRDEYAGRTEPDEDKSEDAIVDQINALEARLSRSRIDDKLLDADYLLSLWLDAILTSNHASFGYFKERILEAFQEVTNRPTLRGSSVSLIGVSYKPGTLEITNAPSLRILAWLVEQGVQKIKIYDPLASDTIKEWIDGKKSIIGSSYQAVQFEYLTKAEYAFLNSDMVIYASPLKEIKAETEPSQIRKWVGEKTLIVDGVNVYDYFSKLGEGFSQKDAREAGINVLPYGMRPFGPAFSKIPSRYVESKMIGEKEPTAYDPQKSMTTLIFGTGYVGLTTAISLVTAGVGDANIQNRKVIGYDNRPEIVEKLSAGQMHIYEDGLDRLFRQAISGGPDAQLQFTGQPQPAILQSDVIYFAVGTPPKKNNGGQIDLSQILDAAETVAETLLTLPAERRRENPKLIVIKSTVTSNTFPIIETKLREMGLELGLDYDLASNPEFLREGKAVYDSGEGMNRFVLGIYPPAAPDEVVRASVERTEKKLLELWAPHRNHFFARRGKTYPIVVTDAASSTLSKYYANTELASNISLANTFSLAAESSDNALTYYSWLQSILKAHDRVSKYVFNHPGCGYGGSCFPKDVIAIHNLSLEVAGKSVILGRLAHVLNKIFKRRIAYELARSLVGTSRARGEQPLAGKQVGLAGITFKAGTGDVREASSAQIAADIYLLGGKVRLFDPVLNEDPENRDLVKKNFEAEFVRVYAETSQGDYETPAQAEAAARGAFSSGAVSFAVDTGELFRAQNAVVIVNEWPQFKQLPLDELIPTMLANDEGRNPVLFDARNLLDPAAVDIQSEQLHFYSPGVGRPSLGPVRSELRHPTASFVMPRRVVDGSEWLGNIYPGENQIAERFSVTEAAARQSLTAALTSTLDQAARFRDEVFRRAAAIWGEEQAAVLIRTQAEVPIHLAQPVDFKKMTVEDFMTLGMILSQHPRNKIFLLSETDLKVSRAKIDSLAHLAEVRYKVSPSFKNRIQPVAVANGRWQEAFDALADQDSNQALGVFIQPSSPAAHLRFRRNLKKFRDSSSRLSTPAAWLLSASMLRHVPKDQGYEPYDLVAWANQNNIDVTQFGAQLHNLLESFKSLSQSA